MGTFVIAEGGICHDRKKDRLLRMVEFAKEAGASAFKMQFWSSSEALAERRRQKDASVYKRYKVPATWVVEAKKKCDEVGLEFLCTVYLRQDINFVSDLVSRFKIASPEALDQIFVDLHYSYNKEVIISCGSNPQRYVEPKTRWLHCISRYPAPVESLRLRDVRDYDGFSDHSGLEDTGMMAVCAGARYIEVHFRAHDTDVDNPDYLVSHSPTALVSYINRVRLAEQAMYGCSTKKESPVQTAPSPSRPPSSAQPFLAADAPGGPSGDLSPELL